MKSIAAGPLDVSNIFYFFLLGGGERGARGARKGRGLGFFFEIPGGGGGGFSHKRGGGGRWAGRVPAGNLGGGG